jgi:2-dehydro-3-deoxygalactonokinase
MNSDASDPAIIGIDWGTTSFRAYLMARDGEILDNVSAKLGIMQVADKNFEAALLKCLNEKNWDHKLPIITSGMITSRNGWVETEYVEAPATLDKLSNQLHVHHCDDLTLHFITGVIADHNGAADVMRGEEVQLFGALDEDENQNLFVMPGTHSKWVMMNEGCIQDFFTFMTGDVYSAVSQNTILKAFIEDAPFNKEAFSMGVQKSISDGAMILHDLFSVRTLPLMKKISPQMTDDYLSGLLIGCEIANADRFEHGGLVTIIGNDELSKRYELALKIAGIHSKNAASDIVARGHYLIARKIGLI